MKKTFSIISLGCPRNLVDSENIVEEFKKKGFSFKDEVLGCDTLIINTCAFIKEAKEESIDTILKAVDLKKSGDIKKLIVTGCLTERYPREIKKEIKEIDLVRGVTNFKETFSKKTSSKLTPRHYAYVKISEGCRNKCTYCVIPYLKGPYKSRPIESILKEAKSLVTRGVKEIILIGQDTSLYGIDLYKKKRLGELLKKMDKICRKDTWIKLLYLHPSNIDYDLIKIIKESNNICKYIDLPIEHINNRILKQMGRKTKKEDIVSLIEYIRREIPRAALRTSVIVGFPGETKKEFNELASFIKEAKFERLGVFRYSKEEGTPAYKLKKHIAEKEKENRFNKLMEIQQNISRNVNNNFKGRVLKVLVEEKEKDYYIGRSEYDSPEVDGVVYIKTKKNLKIGNFYNACIIDTYEYDLLGI